MTRDRPRRLPVLGCQARRRSSMHHGEPEAADHTSERGEEVQQPVQQRAVNEGGSKAYGHEHHPALTCISRRRPRSTPRANAEETWVRIDLTYEAVTSPRRRGSRGWSVVSRP